MRANKNKSSIFLKIDGENLSTTSLTIPEISKVLGLIEGITLDVADNEGFNLSLRLNSLKPGSVGIALEGIDLEPDTLPNIYKKVSEVFRTGFSDASNLLLKKVDELNKFLKSKSAWIDILENENSKTTITKILVNENLITSNYKNIKGSTTIYGKVIRIGGKTPAVMIEIDKDKNLSFSIKEEYINFFANNLYKNVVLYGIAEWEPNTLSLKDFNLEKAEPLKLKSMKDTVKVIKNNFGKHFDKIENPDQWVKENR